MKSHDPSQFEDIEPQNPTLPDTGWVFDDWEAERRLAGLLSDISCAVDLLDGATHLARIARQNAAQIIVHAEFIDDIYFPFG